MSALPQVVPISDMRARQNELLAGLEEGPVVFTQYGRSVAVLVGVGQWNRITEDLEDADDTIAALKAKLALATGEDELLDWEVEEAGGDLVPA